MGSPSCLLVDLAADTGDRVDVTGTAAPIPHAHDPGGPDSITTRSAVTGTVGMVTRVAHRPLCTPTFRSPLAPGGRHGHDVDPPG